eukprot:COSAG01_NODE_62548_length_284_cov_0.610811_1_plen_53_part_10
MFVHPTKNAESCSCFCELDQPQLSIQGRMATDCAVRVQITSTPARPMSDTTTH